MFVPGAAIVQLLLALRPLARPLHEEVPQLPLYQFDSAVFRPAHFRFIGSDGGIHAATERIQPICAYPVLATEFRNDANCTPMTQVEVVVWFSLVVRVPDNV
jgi:hypothetical protein